MGWWSADVMGGDTPLDIVGDIADSCGLDYDYERTGEKLEGPLAAYAFTKELVKENISKIVWKFQTELNCFPDEIEIAYQVLGIVLMATGAHISEELVERILAASNRDEWAKEDDERERYMADFREMLVEYDEKPTPYTSVSLLQKFASLGKLEIVHVK